MEDCTPRCWAMKLLVLGIVLILVRMYTAWDIWVVLGVLLIVKGILMFIMPRCACQTKPKSKK